MGVHGGGGDENGGGGCGGGRRGFEAVTLKSDIGFMGLGASDVSYVVAKTGWVPTFWQTCRGGKCRQPASIWSPSIIPDHQQTHSDRKKGLGDTKNCGACALMRTGRVNSSVRLRTGYRRV